MSSRFSGDMVSQKVRDGMRVTKEDTHCGPLFSIDVHTPKGTHTYNMDKARLGSATKKY